MILWVVLFILVVAISFVLAAQSMRDYSEDPEKDRNYSLFLIRNTQGLSAQVLSSIKNELSETKSIISFERLFKGAKSALVVFGPRDLVLNHKTTLDLLELEDYTNVAAELISAWEMGTRKDIKITQKLFTNMPSLLDHEQFWHQVIFSHTLKPQITQIFISSEESRRHTFVTSLHNISHELHKLPKAFSNPQFLEFYQKRSYRTDNKNHHTKEEELLNLLLI